MQRFKIRYEGKFSKESWEHYIGKTIPFKIADRKICDATIISAVIGEEFTELEFEIPGGTQLDRILVMNPDRYSFNISPDKMSVAPVPSKELKNGKGK